jgi:hypothetical protein
MESLYTLTKKKTHYLIDWAYEWNITRQVMDVNRAGNIWESSFIVKVNEWGINITDDSVLVA